MEDTVWLWPHRNDRAESNPQFLELAKSLATVLGRDIATHEEYREIVGMPAREPAKA
jgi:3-keto-5-aminohexanoate cleavage enzyme